MISWVATSALLQHLLATSTTLTAEAASCGSNEYCPAGWSVKRRTGDYSAVTCEPTAREEGKGKCPKPYMCVAAKCGINFCCVNDKMLTKMRAHEESMAEDQDDQDSSSNDGDGGFSAADGKSTNKKHGEL